MEYPQSCLRMIYLGKNILRGFEGCIWFLGEDNNMKTSYRGGAPLPDRAKGNAFHLWRKASPASERIH
jgi:hypothetical protein